MSGAYERVLKILKQAETFFFATSDDGQPNVRPFNAVCAFEDKVYFYTNNHKNAYKQMKKNPKVELCAVISEDRWIRVSGEAVFDERAEAKRQMLEENPRLKKIYSENDKIFEVFYLNNMSAKIHSLYTSPETVC